jgi:site-specific recombinase XerD
MTTQTLVQGSDAGQWDQAIYAFLAEKERRSGSMRTVRAYSGMLYRFFDTLGKTPDQVTATEVFGYAHGTGLSGKKPSSVTIGARIACLSSFYRFLIRMSLVSANPCDQLERPKATPAPPRGLTAADIRKLLDAIPNYPVGLRDRAIILTLTLTGRRRAEVLNLKARDLIQDGEAVYYSYRGKGGKYGKRELPQPAFRAIQQALEAFGKDFPGPRCGQTNPCGHPAPIIGAESPAAPSTATFAGISRLPACLRRASISSATQRPGFAETPESRWSKLSGFWTTVL